MRLKWWAGGFCLDDADLAMGLVEFDGPIAKREERPIATYAHAFAGVMLGTALADNDATREDFLTAKQFDAKAFGNAIATVAG